MNASCSTSGPTLRPGRSEDHGGAVLAGGAVIPHPASQGVRGTRPIRTTASADLITGLSSVRFQSVVSANFRRSDQ